MAENVSAEAPGNEGESRPLEVYEWGGGIVASLGFFLTPAVTGLPALYCALKVQEEKPLAAIGIGVILLATMLFWTGFLFGEQAINLLASDGAATGPMVFLVFLVILIFPVLGFLAVLLWRR